MRLLLIEDHVDLAVWVAKTLRHSGFVVDAIARGDHAATVLLTQTYDLVILEPSVTRSFGASIAFSAAATPRAAVSACALCRKSARLMAARSILATVPAAASPSRSSFDRRPPSDSRLHWKRQ